MFASEKEESIYHVGGCSIKVYMNCIYIGTEKPTKNAAGWNVAWLPYFYRNVDIDVMKSKILIFA